MAAAARRHPIFPALPADWSWRAGRFAGWNRGYLSYQRLDLANGHGEKVDGRTMREREVSAHVPLLPYTGGML